MSEYLLTEIQPGNRVRHLKGRQEMTVVWVADYLARPAANCEWDAKYCGKPMKDNRIYFITELGKISD